MAVCGCEPVFCAPWLCGCAAVRLRAARAAKRWLAVCSVLKSCSVPNP
ncbi:hypothetical protein [Mycobacterium phage MS810]